MMRPSLSPLLAGCLLLFPLLIPLASAADYREQLVLRPLPLSALLASFNFRSNTSLAEFEAHNFRLFPRSLGQILQHAGTRELHLRFNLGRWDAESWGARPWNGKREGGTGVELWAWLEADTEEEADHRWLTLTNALSGLFCASLNFIDATRTTRPVLSFRPEGDHITGTNATADGGSSSSEDLHLLYGVLPREVVCTENLTPFLKLLPCKGKAGIASLLDGHKLFDASWQSMAVDVRPVCPGGGQPCVLEIEQTIDMVLDVDRSKRPRDNPIPRPPPAHELRCDTSKPYHSDDTCFPADATAGQDWSLSQIFGRPMKGACPLNDPAVPPVCLQVPPDRPAFATVGGGGASAKPPASAGDTSRCFDAAPGEDLDLVVPRVDPPTTELLPPETPSLYAERSFTGHGQERGGVQTILTNPSRDAAVEFVYMESLPWFMRVYLHTLDARLVFDDVDEARGSRGRTDGHRRRRPAAQSWKETSGSHNNHNDNSNSHNYSSGASLIQEVYYRPAVDRERGTQLELRMRVPPASTAFLTYDFEKTILRYTEYPPDANRGFDVAAAVVTVLDGADPTRSTASSYLRTTSLLLSLPTPDFSMPYNVIIFTSTAIALAFGGLFNILVRRFVAADEGPEMGLGALRARLRSRLGRLVGGGSRADVGKANGNGIKT